MNLREEVTMALLLAETELLKHAQPSESEATSNNTALAQVGRAIRLMRESEDELAVEEPPEDAPTRIQLNADGTWLTI